MNRVFIQRTLSLFFTHALIIWSNLAAANQTLLYLGDSQSTITPMGEILKSHLERHLEVPVVLASASGSSPRHWGQSTGIHKDWLCNQPVNYQTSEEVNQNSESICVEGKSVIQRLIEIHRPKYFLLQFLGNSVRLRDEPEKLKTHIFALLNSIPRNSHCLWLTSPPAENSVSNGPRLQTQELIAELILEYQRKSTLKCQLIRGVNDQSLSQMSEHPEYYMDGYHLTESGAHHFLELTFYQITTLWEFD